MNAKGSGASRENGKRNGKENAFAMYDSRERPALGGDRAYMEVRREQAKISDYCGFESRLLRNRSDALFMFLLF